MTDLSGLVAPSIRKNVLLGINHIDYAPGHQLDDITDLNIGRAGDMIFKDIQANGINLAYVFNDPKGNNPLTTTNMGWWTGGIIGGAGVNGGAQMVGTNQVSKAKGAVTTFDGSGNVTLYTVTAGKTFYMTALSLLDTSALSNIKIGDGSVSTVLWAFRSGATTNESQAFTFPTPIPFSTSVFANGNANESVIYGVSGWEQ